MPKQIGPPGDYWRLKFGTSLLPLNIQHRFKTLLQFNFKFGETKQKQWAKSGESGGMGTVTMLLLVTNYGHLSRVRERTSQ
jgi:hypothetical protein